MIRKHDQMWRSEIRFGTVVKSKSCSEHFWPIEIEQIPPNIAGTFLWSSTRQGVWKATFLMLPWCCFPFSIFQHGAGSVSSSKPKGKRKPAAPSVRWKGTRRNQGWPFPLSWAKAWRRRTWRVAVLFLVTPWRFQGSTVQILKSQLVTSHLEDFYFSHAEYLVNFLQPASWDLPTI